MEASNKIPFSARNRGQHGQIDGEFPPSARTGIVHLLFDLVSKSYVAGWPAIANEVQRIGRLPPVEYPALSVAGTRKAREEAEAALKSLKWDKVYDFCERLYGHLSREIGHYDEREEYSVVTPRGDVQAYIAAELQRLFLEENLAFEFSEGAVRRRGRKHTVETAARAQMVLGDPRLASARKHYDKALQFFRSPTKPDFENSVKEAVCAVEAAAKSLFPAAKATTLGDFVKWLGSTKEVAVPKAISMTITGVYAFRSGGDGVGHGGGTGGTATAEVAEYILAVCASQIIYLVDLANAQEPDIPF